MKLEQLGKNTFLLYGTTNIGFYLCGKNEVIVIDTGLNDDSAKQIIKICEEHNWNIKYIINTHSHSDHIGGNSYIQNKLNIPIYSNKMNIFFCKYPFLQNAMAYGGFPFKQLNHPLLVSDISEVKQIEENLLPDNIEIINLPGHCEDMIGIKTDDEVFFLSDALAGVKVLDKFKVQFIYDIKSELKTLNDLKNLKGKYFVPSHGEVSENIIELVNKNIENINFIIDLLKTICNIPKTFDKIMKEIFDYFHMKMNSVQYCIVSVTIKCYLSYMLNEAILENEVKDNLLLWKKLKKKA